MDLSAIREFSVRIDNRSHLARFGGTGPEGEVILLPHEPCFHEEGELARDAEVTFAAEGVVYVFTCRVYCADPNRIVLTHRSGVRHEHRRAQRYRTHRIPVSVAEHHFLRRGAGDAHLVNVSTTGARIGTQHPLDTDTFYGLEMRIPLRRGSATFRAPFRPTHALGGHPDVIHGGPFGSLDPDNRHLLEKYIAGIAHGGRDFLNE